ncbi:MAG TPA: cytochrome b/b6 domain-containing protein [Luteimonas sp.]|nr:cytochrome b/b6 domain-containing protein [Luteimonas sp.]
MSSSTSAAVVQAPEPGVAATQASGGARFEWRTVLRHPLPLRLMHWINLLCMLVLVGSGLQIFNAHPALYWGPVSTFDAPVFATDVARGPDGKARGITTIDGHRFDTTGVLGVSPRADGMRVKRGFPEWATIPGPRSLALGRRWHFFFAWLWVINGTCYLLWSLASRHLARDLAMQRRDWRAVPASIVEHLRFRHPVGDEAARYNPLQKLAYLAVIFLLAPLAVLTGLSMSPQMDGVLGWWLQVVGGRQSARTIHFIVMSLFVLFTLVHVLMVVYAGPVNEMRSMISGRFRVRYPRSAEGGRDG